MGAPRRPEQIHDTRFLTTADRAIGIGESFNLKTGHGTRQRGTIALDIILQVARCKDLSVSMASRMTADFVASFMQTDNLRHVCELPRSETLRKQVARNKEGA